jgi:uncharacterized membrane protein YdjX (TVP38/TMEM64 family)
MKYPKFTIFFITIFVAYILFQNQDSNLIQNTLSSLGFIGAFVSGILYVYSFTSTISTSILLILNNNIILTGLIAGLGALTGDIIIYKFINHSFDNELNLLRKEKIIKKIKINKHIKKYILPILAIITISSPLPDEIGVALLAASKKVIPKKYTYLLFYLLNTIGIFIILIIGKQI